ncbi:MAG: hypothetical protein V1715_13300 [bacterium]
MTTARIHLSPVYALLTIADDEKPPEPIYQHKATLNLLKTGFSHDPEEPNGFATVERVLGEFLTLAEKRSAKLTRITVAADLADAEMLILLRLFLKKLNLPPIAILDFASEFDQMRGQISGSPQEYLAVVAGEAKLRFIKVSQNHPEFTVTLPCGIITLTHKFIQNDPPEPAEIIALRDHLSAEFDRLQWHRLPEQILTFSDTGLALARLIGDTSATGGSILTKDQLQIILPELSHNYKNQIASRPSADPDFSDYYLTTAVLYEHLLDYLGQEQVRIYSQSIVTR